jgi:hypothetical protein
MPFVRKNKKDCVHLELLRGYIDMNFGLNQPGVSPNTKRFVREVVNLMCKPHTGYFPGSFMKAAKDLNNVKQAEGLLIRMGYCSVKPNINKIIHVAQAQLEAKTGNDGKVGAAYVAKENLVDLPHDKHYMAAARLLLPLVSSRGKAPAKKEINASVRKISPSALGFYRKHNELNEGLNKAYAFLSSNKKKPRGKTKLAHVASARSSYARSVIAAIPDLVDGNGNTYLNYMDVPSEWRHLLESLCKRKLSRARRAAKRGLSDDAQQNDSDSASEDAEPEPQGVSSPSTSSDSIAEPKEKKTKLASVEEEKAAAMQS